MTPRLLELEPQVVPLAGALADAGEHRHAAVVLGEVEDQLLDDDGLAHAGAAEQPDLAAAQVGLDQVDDLDARLEHLELGRLLHEARRLAVNRVALRGLYGAHLVDRLAQDVHDATERLGAHGHGDRPTGVDRLHAAHHAFSRQHAHAAHPVLAQVLLPPR